MLVGKIMNTAGIAAAALSLYACTPKHTNGNSSKNDTIRTEVSYNDTAPEITTLTNNYKGMKVVYNSKEDSIRVNNYLDKVVREALPTDKIFNNCCDMFIYLERERADLLAKGDSAAADAKLPQLTRFEQKIDSLWSELKEKTILSDSINKYAKESDFEPNKEYLYEWFKR